MIEILLGVVGVYFAVLAFFAIIGGVFGGLNKVADYISGRNDETPPT